MELRIITKRYADMRLDFLDRGALLGKPTWGFRIVGEKGNKTIEPDLELVPYLRGMVERRSRGDTLLSICRWLGAEGAKPSRSAVWHPMTVRKVLTSPALKGRRLNEAGKVILRHEGIMSASERGKLQAVIDANPHRGPTTADTAPLTHAVICDLCDRPMLHHKTWNLRKDGTRSYNHYYRCKGTDVEASTCRNMIPQAELEDWADHWFTEDGPFANVELVETIVVPGYDHAAELAEGLRPRSANLTLMTFLGQTKRTSGGACPPQGIAT
jgi:hypothetical protein